MTGSHCDKYEALTLRKKQQTDSQTTKQHFEDGVRKMGKGRKTESITGVGLGGIQGDLVGKRWQRKEFLRLRDISSACP